MSVISGLSGNTQGICLYFKGCYSSIYRVCDMSCFASNFLNRAFRNLKKNTGKPSYRKPAGTFAKKKNEEVFPHN